MTAPIPQFAPYESAVPQHTPGPWKANPKRLVVGEMMGPMMSYLAGDRTTGEGMTVSIASERIADHYLCAAAPDLLQALKFLYDDHVDYLTRNNLGGMDNHGMKLARAAIAKATEKP